MWTTHYLRIEGQCRFRHSGSEKLIIKDTRLRQSGACGESQDVELTGSPNSLPVISVSAPLADRRAIAAALR